MSKSSEHRLEHIVRSMLGDRSTDAPADAVKFARDLFRTRVIEPRHSALRRWVATLAADLARNKPAFGERSGSSGQARQMLFETESAAIDLRISMSVKKFEVRGQVLGAGFEGAKISLSSDGMSFEADADEMCGFRIGPVAAGEYRLIVRSETDEIVIDKLSIN